VTGLMIAPDSLRLLDGSRPCYRVYKCASGAYALGALEPKFWQRFCEAVGRADWLDRAFDSTLVPEMEALFLARARDEWEGVLRPADCSAEPVLSLEELRSHPLFSASFAGELLRTYPALSSAVPSKPAPNQGEHSLATLLKEWRS